MVSRQFVIIINREEADSARGAGISSFGLVAIRFYKAHGLIFTASEIEHGKDFAFAESECGAFYRVTYTEKQVLE